MELITAVLFVLIVPLIQCSDRTGDLSGIINGYILFFFKIHRDTHYIQMYKSNRYTHSIQMHKINRDTHCIHVHMYQMNRETY